VGLQKQYLRAWDFHPSLSSTTDLHSSFAPPGQNRARGRSLAAEFERDGYQVFSVLLGSGMFSSVKSGKNTLTGQELAVKVVDLTENRQVFDREVEALRRLHHPNLITLVDVIWADKKGYLFMEKLEEPMTLEDFIHDFYPSNEETIALHVSQLLDGLEEMHAQGIAHRDLKPSNVLICGSDHTKVVICDFGLCYISPVIRPYRHWADEALGSPLFMPPEVILSSAGLSNLGYEPFRYDSWGLGMLIYSMLTGTSLFAHIRVPAVLLEAVQQLERVSLPDTVPPRYIPLLEGLLCVDPLKRWTIQKTKQEFHKVTQKQDS